LNTTIAISTDIRNQIKEFGNKGETYEEILQRLLQSAKDRQLPELLMDSEDCVNIDEAIDRAKKKWQ